MSEVPDGVWECWEKPCPNCNGTGKVTDFENTLENMFNALPTPFCAGKEYQVK